MNKKRQTITAVIGLLGVLAIISGVTYAWFSYSKTGTKENVITAGKIKFIYTEETNGLTLSDAMPMTDAQGKAQASPAYFDFKVASETSSSVQIPYIVTVRVKPEANASDQLDAKNVKVWLSDQTNNELVAGENGVKFFQDTVPARTAGTFLEAYTGAYNPSDGTNYRYNERIIYSGVVPAGESNYSQGFRLRMWLDENTDFSPIPKPAHCSNATYTTEADCLTPKGEWINNSCTISGITDQAICIATSVNKWIAAGEENDYPNNGKKFTVTVNVYANGEAVSQNFTASEVSYTPPTGINTSCTEANATLDCALGELETRLGS